MQNEECRTTDEFGTPSRDNIAAHLFYAENPDDLPGNMPSVFPIFFQRSESANARYYRMADRILERFDVRFWPEKECPEPAPDAVNAAESEPSEASPGPACCVKIPGKTGRDLVARLLGKTVPLEQFTYAEGKADAFENALRIVVAAFSPPLPVWEEEDGDDEGGEPDTEAAETSVEAA